MPQFEKSAEWYYSDNKKIQKKACAAGRYIDRIGMTPTGLQFWFKYFDWWNDDFSLKCPKRFYQYIKEFEKFFYLAKLS